MSENAAEDMLIMSENAAQDMLMLMMLMMMLKMMRKEKEADMLREKSNNPNLKGGDILKTTSKLFRKLITNINKLLNK